MIGYFLDNIIANNFIASCYATYHHRLMHLLTIPAQYWYQLDVFSHLNSLISYLVDFSSMTMF